MAAYWSRARRSRFGIARKYSTRIWAARRCSMADTPIIEARDLHTYYGASHVLHGIDFVVRRGETIGLMGRNGMGKTTLLGTLIGHLRPRRGSVRVFGHDMTRAEPHLI